MEGADSLIEVETMRVALDSTGSYTRPSGIIGPDWRNQDGERYTNAERSALTHYNMSG